MAPSSSGSRPRFVVLAAIDDSPMKHDIVRAGANLARESPGGELHVVHVVEDLPPAISPVPAPMGMGLTTTEIVGAARSRLDQVAAEARRQFSGRIVEHLALGSAWKQILQVAIDVQADLIVVGTHGRAGVKRLLLGSVAEGVVRKASCPVLVVREKDYHAFVPPEIEPACPECLVVQRQSGGARLWCDRHAEHHPHAHLHYEIPESFGLGSQLFRP